MIYDKWALTKPDGDRQYGGTDLKDLQNYLFRHDYIQLEVDGVLDDTRYNSASNLVVEAIEFESIDNNFICSDTRPIISSIRKKIHISAVDRVNVVFDDGHVIPLSQYTCESKKRRFRSDILKVGDVVRFTLNDRREDEVNEYGDIDECIGYVKCVRPLNLIIMYAVGSHVESLNIAISDLFDVYGCRGGDEELVTLSIEVLNVDAM